MSKQAKERALAANEAKAVRSIAFASALPQKLNLVASMIRGTNVSQALVQLTFNSKRISGDVKKALQSAIANAENNHNLNVDSLYVKEAYVGKNLVMKRMHTRGRGRSAQVLKPFANLTPILCEKAEEAPKTKKVKAKATEAKKPAATKAPAKAKKESVLMGQKVNAISLRVGINRTWDSRWYAGADYADKLHEDFQITKYLKKTLDAAGVSKIVIERPTKKAHVTIHTARPGVVIGKKGADIDKIKKDLSKFTKDEVHVNIVPVAKPELDATLIAESVAQQLEKRVAFRRAMKRAVQSCLRLGAQGIRINVSGRLGGAEIARMEWYREGRAAVGDAACRCRLWRCACVGNRLWHHRR